MPRAVDVQALSSPAQGFNMITNTRKSWVKPSLATGVTPGAVTDAAQAGPGSPGAVLGTGMNADLYTPGIEAV